MIAVIGVSCTPDPAPLLRPADSPISTPTLKPITMPSVAASAAPSAPAGAAAEDLHDAHPAPTEPPERHFAASWSDPEAVALLAKDCATQPPPFEPHGFADADP